MESVVDSSIHTFANHGCGGSSNFGYDLEVTEETADPDQIPDEILNEYFGEEIVYNPAAERQPHFYPMAQPLRNVAKDEEIFMSYLALGGHEVEGWGEDVYHLREICTGVPGHVVEREREVRGQ